MTWGRASVRILLANDDGILSPGLWHAAEALQDVGDVVVCAPDREQSGIGTAVTLHSPIRAVAFPPRSGAGRAFAVEGTPADSVILGLERLLEGPADLVVAGINVGANMGQDVLISGTLSAALQGHLRNIPSIAISVASLRDVHYEAARQVLTSLARGLTQGRSGLRTGGGAALAAPPFLNVNLPNLPLADIKGVVVTRLAPQGYRDTVNQGTDGRRPWHWIARDQPPAEAAEGTDFWAVRNGMVSVTPLSTDITAHDAMPAVSDLVRSLPLPPVRD